MGHLEQKKQTLQENYNNFVHEKHTTQVPIYKGCKNEQCYCTGECKEIVGWRDKHPLEL